MQSVSTKFAKHRKNCTDTMGKTLVLRYKREKDDINYIPECPWGIPSVVWYYCFCSPEQGLYASSASRCFQGNELILPAMRQLCPLSGQSCLLIFIPTGAVPVTFLTPGPFLSIRTMYLYQSSISLNGKTWSCMYPCIRPIHHFSHTT